MNSNVINSTTSRPVRLKSAEENLIMQLRSIQDRELYSNKLEREIRELDQLHLNSSEVTDKSFIQISLISRIFLNYLNSFEKKERTLNDLEESEVISSDELKFIQFMNEKRSSFIIFGSVCTGKTTLLKAIANELPKEEICFVYDPHKEIKEFSNKKDNIIYLDNTNISELLNKKEKNKTLIINEIRNVDELIYVLNAIKLNVRVIATTHSSSKCLDKVDAKEENERARKILLLRFLAMLDNKEAENFQDMILGDSLNEKNVFLMLMDTVSYRKFKLTHILKL